ncbi:hypothetical protein VTN02DRAFT_1431 [Thermoascus thermophilus]
MNQLLWGGILVRHQDLTAVRRASSLLAAAVLTVAALHMPDRTATLDRCHDEFVSLVSGMALTRAHTLDDVRGLCVGAFWLSELSWTLSGHAVRIAAELGLHQSFQLMARGRAEQYERAQRWYVLYVCDHHFSIAYGRGRRHPQPRGAPALAARGAGRRAAAGAGGAVRDPDRGLPRLGMRPRDGAGGGGFRTVARVQRRRGPVAAVVAAPVRSVDPVSVVVCSN